MWIGTLWGLWLLVGVAAPAPGQAPTEGQIVDVRVEGNQRVPSDRLLSLVRSRVGRAYSQRTIDADVRRLERTRQFYDVVAVARPATGGVAVVFKVLERPLVDELLIQGNEHISTDEITSGVSIGKGLPQSVAGNQYARQYILDMYYKKGYAFAKVTLTSGAREGETTVAFRIVEGPRVRVTDVGIAGNTTLATSELKKLITTKPPFLRLFGGWYNRKLVQADLEALRRTYRSQGFMNVRVERKEDFNDDRRKVAVTYVVDEGEAFSVAELTFTGAVAFEPDTLQSGLKLQPGVRFDQDAMEQDRREVLRRYGQQGYVEALVVAQYRYTQQPNEVTVAYRITEGERFKLRKVLIEGNTLTKDKVVRRRVVMEPGEWFDTVKMERSRKLVSESGVFRPFRFVLFTGPPDERPPLPPGAEEAEDGFREPMPHLEILGHEPGWRDLLVEVEETETGMFSAGVGVTSDDGLIGSFQITQRNFDIARFPRNWDDLWSGRAWRGAGQRFQLTLQPGTEVNRFDVSFVEPYLLDQPIRMSASAFFSTRDRDFWDEQRVGMRINFLRDLTDTWAVGVGASIQNINVDGIDTLAPVDAFDAEGDNVLLSVPLSLVYDDRDSRMFPTSGTLVRLEAEPYVGDWNFLSLKADARRYWRLRSRPDGTRPHVLMARGVVGYLAGDTPIFQRFYAGGSRSLRGFEYRGAGPHVAGEPVGGDWLFLSTLEYQYPIIEKRLRGVLFLDAGTVEESVGADDLRASVGFGFRIALDVLGGVPIAIDFGVPLAEGEDDETQVFHFSVGWTF